MKITSKKTTAFIGILIIVIAVVAVFVLSRRGADSFRGKYEGYDLSKDVVGMEREGTYDKYLLAHEGTAYPDQALEVDLFAYKEAEDVEEYRDYYGESRVLYTGSDSSVTWTVNVPQSGFYNMYIEYLAPESKGVAVERAVYINGELPFEKAANLTFTRMWTDGGAVRIDNQGNEIRPTQVEHFDWQASYFRDDMGYVPEPYKFYFEKGDNEITLTAENEPLVIRKLMVRTVQTLPAYQDYIAAQPAVNATGMGLDYQQKVQGEASTFRSESSLYAKYDRSSPSTQPNSVTKTLLNYVGGEAWSSSGQWIEWDFEVPEDGYYNIMIKGRQNYSRGSVSSRILYIDGEIPFQEMQRVSFDYSNGWNCMQLADENGDAYKFYLTEGKHTLRLEAALGEAGTILNDLENSIYRLNQMYRKILVYTGATPDKYRDYNIHKVYPEVVKAMDLEAKRLFKIVDEMVDYSGQKADSIASAQTVAQQLERFVDNPQKITLEFTTFKDNITALGTATLNMSSTKLDIDYISVTGVNKKPDKDKETFFAKIWHEMKSFGASFVVDYDAVGDVYEDKNDNVVKVWISTGRDQGTILKAMVDDTFIPNTGIKVNVEIVDAGALMNAVVAGRGPNVVLSIGADQPVNYALRNAVEDLSQFDDLREVLAAYTPSSYEQYRLGDSVYAIPETQTFNVMFYRKDVLEELGLEVPQTWQDLIEMLPTIQGNNMSVGLPTAAGSSGSTASTAVASTTPDLSMYFSLLYQYGGDLYNEEGTRTVVNSEAGVKAFDDYTRFFVDYGLPTIYDFVSRFRSGEMPIGVMAYSVYNTLMVSAPEIRGLWDFTLIPGTERTDENGNTYIDRSDFITGSATMMIKTEDESLRKDAWEFMKWWAQADTQVRFGREIEALLGSSARYATANKEAFSNLAWSADDIAVLNEQWEQTVGIREVPGGYYTGRHISNAIRKVINEKSDPRETIIDYTITIDDEITKKRKEFGMSVQE